MQNLNTEIPLSDCWINGEKRSADERFAVLMPATGETITSVADASAALTLEAIDAAECAFHTWKNSDPKFRYDLLIAWGNQLEKNKKNLAALICCESGKVYSEAEGEINHCITMLRWYAEECRRLQGNCIQTSATQQHLTYKQATGVVACITPWNFPAAAVIVKAGAALAAGCTVVLKPSEETPLIGLALSYFASEAGFPKGTLNTITTSKPEIFSESLKDSRIRMLSFTGSTAVGKHLYQLCSSTIKRIALELGGNAPFILFDDCDIDVAVNAVINARFYNAGQICVGANRIYVHTKIYSAFCEALKQKAGSLRVGDGFSETSDLGPLINHKSVKRLKELVDDAILKGAKLLCGGSACTEHPLMFKPSVLTNMNENMRACHEEIFGPVACLYPFSEEEEVLKKANATNSGLAAYVYTNHYPRLMRVAQQLEAGAVGANSTQLFADNVPFGGIKESGLGKEQGQHCLEEFLETKSVSLGISE